MDTKKQSSYLLDGLSISKLVLGPGEKAKWIRLPSTFTRKIPVDHTEIATPAKLKQWEHLDRISGETSGNERMITVDLAIPSQENVSYAIRTALGWQVMDQLN